MRPVFWPFSGQVRAPVGRGSISIGGGTNHGAMHDLPARRFHGVVVPPLERLHLTDQDPLPNCCLRRSMSIWGVILLGSHLPPLPFLNISTVEPLPCFLD